MLSRVADSLYWMSRYFERADHCARVLDANYNLLLNPAKASREKRWKRTMESLGLHEPSGDPSDITRLIFDKENRSSLLACIVGARENASQVREQISSEMWERLNQLYHEVNSLTFRNLTHQEPLRILAAFREGTYKFHGVTEATMNHGEGWYFIQVGKYMERATDVSRLVGAHFLESADADDLDWVGLLASCSAFEAYRKVYTSELSDHFVAEFLLLNNEFPYTVRYSADHMRHALNAISEVLSARKTAGMERTVGKLRSSLAYVQIDEILKSDLHAFLRGILEQCNKLHAAIHELFIDYPIESALEV